MDAGAHLEQLRTEGAALVEAVRRGDPGAAVPACPDWTLRDLATHVGGVHRWATAIVETRSTERVKRDRSLQPGSDLAAWVAEGVDALVAALEAAGPDEAVWTFGPEPVSSFWFRRQAQETAVHRWDAESASGDAAPIDAELAVDGVDEMLLGFAPMMDIPAKLGDAGRTIHLHATDADGEWFLTLGPGALTVTKEHAKGDVAARGTASDLLLFLWGRIPPARLEVFGDADLLADWQRVVQV